MPESVDLAISFPRLDGLSATQIRRRIEDAVRASEGAAQEHARKQGRTFAATAELHHMSPFNAPRTREPRRRLSPSIASRDVRVRTAALAGRAEFLRKYRAALASWLDGVRTVCFPFGTYLMRLRHGALCAQA